MWYFQIIFASRQRSIMILISGIALCVATVFALLYALRLWIPLPWLHIPRMWAIHGSIQVFGFALCGLIGWWQMTVRCRPVGIDRTQSLGNALGKWFQP